MNPTEHDADPALPLPAADGAAGTSLPFEGLEVAVDEEPDAGLDDAPLGGAPDTHDIDSEAGDSGLDDATVALEVDATEVDAESSGSWIDPAEGERGPIPLEVDEAAHTDDDEDGPVDVETPALPLSPMAPPATADADDETGIPRGPDD